jgi:hypothetical protein
MKAALSFCAVLVAQAKHYATLACLNRYDWWLGVVRDCLFYWLLPSASSDAAHDAFHTRSHALPESTISALMCVA